MPQNGDDETDRRTVLKSLTAGAVGAATFSSLASASSTEPDGPTPADERLEPDRVVESLDDVEATGDCETVTEYRCSGSCPKSYDYQKAETRDCLKCGGGYISCEDWSYIGRCCF